MKQQESFHWSSEGIEAQSVMLYSLCTITKPERDYIDMHISDTKLRKVHIFLCSELRIGRESHGEVKRGEGIVT